MFEDGVAPYFSFPDRWTKRRTLFIQGQGVKRELDVVVKCRVEELVFAQEIRETEPLDEVRGWNAQRANGIPDAYGLDFNFTR